MRSVVIVVSLASTACWRPWKFQAETGPTSWLRCRAAR